MRVDIGAIADDVARKREARAVAESRPFLVDVIRESRLLSEFTCWPETLDEHEDLEVEDFTDPRNVVLFRAMRLAQHTCGAIELRDVFDALDKLDIDGDVRGSVYEHIGLIAIKYPAPLGERGRHEFAGYLRVLAERRRAL